MSCVDKLPAGMGTECYAVCDLGARATVKCGGATEDADVLCAAACANEDETTVGEVGTDTHNSAKHMCLN